MTLEPKPPASPTPEELVGDQLRRLRKARRWSQETVARKMSDAGFGMHQSTVGRIEAAELPLRLNEAVALAALYGVSLDELLGGTTGLDREAIDQQIKETQERLREAERKYDRVASAWRNAEADLAQRETEEREAFGQMTLQRATLEALERARQQAEARK